MKASLSFVFAAVFLLTACTGGANATPTPPPDPLTLVSQAADAIRAAESFRLIVDQSGPTYTINTDFGAVAFRRADAQYVGPNLMQAQISVLALGGLRVDIEVFSRGPEQWFRSPVWTGGQWVNAQFAPGFNPEALIAQETGFNAALSAIIDLDYAGETTLEDGQRVYHLTGTADGAGMNALLIGLIEMSGQVGVDVYISVDSGFPVRFTLTEGAAADADPRVWTLDLLDINQPAQLDDPEAAATAEATAPAGN